MTILVFYFLLVGIVDICRHPRVCASRGMVRIRDVGEVPIPIWLQGRSRALRLPFLYGAFAFLAGGIQGGSSGSGTSCVQRREDTRWHVRIKICVAFLVQTLEKVVPAP